MSDLYNSPELEELRRLALLREQPFTSDAAVMGGFIARVREAWNRVATKWQVLPRMEQQSVFNLTLVEWLGRRANPAELDRRLIDQDHARTELNRAAGLVTARARSRLGDLVASRMGTGATARRLRIAYFSPLPPAHSGIADYSAELLPNLAELADLTVFSDVPDASTAVGVPVRSTGDFPGRRDEFDLPLYQMGNSSQHESAYDMLLRFPGVVVLHDLILHHFVRHHTAGRADWPGYARELAYTLGIEGRNLGRSVRAGRSTPPLFEVALNRRLIDSSLGVIVHSRFAAGGILQERSDTPLAVAPALAAIHPGRSRRDELGLAEDALLFGSFGQITAEKQIGFALEAFRRVLREWPNAHFLLVGEIRPDVELSSALVGLDLGDHVHHVGYAADMQGFIDWIHTADVVVNLRQPTVGETSAVAMRAMAAARPLIVFDHGWYSELPDSAAIKTAPGDPAALQAAMERLAASPHMRLQMGASGLEYVRRHCLPQAVAQAYIDFIHSLLEPRVSVHD